MCSVGAAKLSSSTDLRAFGCFIFVYLLLLCLIPISPCVFFVLPLVVGGPRSAAPKHVTTRLLQVNPIFRSTMATYDNLRRQSRTLESLIDAKLTSYSRIASAISLGQERSESTGDVEAGLSFARREDMELEIEGLLEKVCPVECIWR